MKDANPFMDVQKTITRLYGGNRDENADWTEDFSHENGQYERTCCICKRVFVGHKRRVVCKICGTKE